MFGAFTFAAAVFGQVAIGGAPALTADATISVSTDATFSLGAPLAADATIAIETAARLTGPYGVLFIINGAGGGQVLYQSLRIHDVLGAQPNTAELTFRSEVATGAAVQIAYNTLAPADLLFSGIVQSQVRQYESVPAITSWAAALVDQTFLANRRRPFGAYVNQSVTTIAQDLITRYAPDFSAAGVQAGLPATSINFDGADPFTTCLQTLANVCGARVKIDYVRTVHLYIPPEASVPPPDPVDAAHPPLNNPPIQFETDLSQVRTRVYGKGHGEQVPSDVLAHETILPVADAVMFSPTGGKTIVGPPP